MKRIEKFPKPNELTGIDYTLAIEIEKDRVFFITFIDDGRYLDIENFKKNRHTDIKLRSAIT